MSAEDVELLRRAWRTMVERDPSGLEYLAEDFEFHMSPELNLEPGVYRGHDAYRWLIRRWTEVWADFRLEPTEFIDVGRGKAIVVARGSGRSRMTGIAMENEIYYVYDIREGRIARIRQMADRASACRVVTVAAERRAGRRPRSLVSLGPGSAARRSASMPPGCPAGRAQSLRSGRAVPRPGARSRVRSPGRRCCAPRAGWWR